MAKPAVQVATNTRVNGVGGRVSHCTTTPFTCSPPPVSSQLGSYCLGSSVHRSLRAMCKEEPSGAEVSHLAINWLFNLGPPI